MKALVSVILAASLAWAAPALAQTQANFRGLFPSIVRVVGMSDTKISLGSGVVVAKSDTGSYVITNYHVIAEADASRIRIVAPKDTSKEGVGKEGAGDGADTIVSPARYVNGDSATDIAVLYVPNFFAPPVPLAVGPAPENLPIRAIGYPGTDLMQWKVLKHTPSMFDGIVSTTQTAPWRSGYPAVGQVQHTAAVNEGMSGGPLMDLCGRVLAIDTAYNADARGDNLALSAADIVPYLQRQNIAYSASKTACDPAAATNDAAAQAQKDQQAAADKKKRDQTHLIEAGAVAAVVIVVGLIVIVLLATRRGGGGTVAKAPGAPPHGILLKGFGEAGGKARIIRAEELAQPIGVEIGRGPDFGSPGTSRRHARLIWSAAHGYVLRDLGSTSGTRVNGREIKGAADQPINLGDVIEFGAPDARYTVEKL